MADFSLSFGQRLRDHHARLKTGFQYDPSEFKLALTQLGRMKEELLGVGELLKNLENNANQLLNLADLIMPAWDEVCEACGRAPNFTFDEQEIWVNGKKNHFFIALGRIFEWMQKRLWEERVANPRVAVTATVFQGWQTISIGDNSPRLDPIYRENLFRPFAGPLGLLSQAGENGEEDFRHPDLYMAQVLIGHHGGSLSDCSDEVESNTGHRLVIRFPLTC